MFVHDEVVLRANRMGASGIVGLRIGRTCAHGYVRLETGLIHQFGEANGWACSFLLIDLGACLLLNYGPISA